MRVLSDLVPDAEWIGGGALVGAGAGAILGGKWGAGGGAVLGGLAGYGAKLLLGALPKLPSLPSPAQISRAAYTASTIPVSSTVASQQKSVNVFVKKAAASSVLQQQLSQETHVPVSQVASREAYAAAVSSFLSSSPRMPAYEFGGR